MNATENTCLGCAAIGLLVYEATLAPELIAGLKNDHEFAQHARQLNMFNEACHYAGEQTCIACGYGFPELGGYGTSPIPRSLEEAQNKKDEYEAARASKETGMAKSQRGIDPEFKRLACESLAAVAATKPFFTADDIWDRIPAPLDREHYRETRHMGIVTMWGAKKGLMAKYNKYVPTSSPRANMTLHNVWKSLVYEGNPDGN